MYTGFFDVINSIIQCSMFMITINYCIDQKYKKDKIQIVALISIISLVIIVITSVMGNYSLSIIILHIISLMLVILPYYKDKLTATIGFSIIYFIICIISIVSFMIFSLFTSLVSIDNKYISLVMVLIVYLPSYIISCFIIKNMKFIYKVYLMIKSRTSSIISFIIITIVCDFIISFSYIVNGKDNPIFMEVIFILLGIFIISVTWYFAIVNKKSNEIYNLNKELEKKINELKKIKHDYGSQISYLYGSYLMKNYDKLGELFKSVIEGNNISTQVKVLSYENSLISKIVNSIDLNDIDILIDEKAKLEDTKINEIDLQRIVSNILRNSVEVLNGKGLLMIKSFYNYNNIVVSIKNNGPKIEKNNIDKIFEQGFSTKENKDRENGFGLYIVKELVNKHNGNIQVKSNEDLTEFIINLPLNL